MATHQNHKAGLGAGIAAAAIAAALGAYFLYGKHGKENRKKVKGWMLKARGEVLDKLERLDEVSEGAYDEIVRGVLANYKGARNVTKSELAELGKDLKKHWQALKPLFNSENRKGATPSRRSPAKHRRKSPKKPS